jgi:Protein of unknown function (DUF2897).
MALKYTANAKFGLKYKDKPDKHQRSASDDDSDDHTDPTIGENDDKK